MQKNTRYVTQLIVNNGPSQLLFPNKILPSEMNFSVNSTCFMGNGLLRFTTVPVRRGRVKPSPAGTVNPLIFTVAHLTASVMSSRDEIVPVQGDGEDAGSASVAVKRDNKVKALEIIVRTLKLVNNLKFHIHFSSLYRVKRNYYLPQAIPGTYYTANVRMIRFA